MMSAPCPGVPLSRLGWTTAVAVALLLPAVWTRPAAQAGRASDPAAFFEPTVTLEPSDHRRLESGEVVVRTLPARGTEMAILAAARVAEGVDGNRLVSWVRRIADLKRGKYVPEIARFSHPPRIADLAGLTLDDDDLNAIRTCRPARCDIKLHAGEIERLQKIVHSAGSGWKADVAQGYREILLARAQAFLVAGLAGIPPYRDQDRPVALDSEFAGILASSGFLATRLPQLHDYLARYPQAASPAVESFLYWSRESLGARPVVAITHVNIARGGAGDVPEAVVAARQVYASHYMTGALAITTITGGGDSPRYLMYLNRSRIDVLDGFFGGVVRSVVGRRLRNEAAEVVDGLRQRLSREIW